MFKVIRAMRSSRPRQQRPARRWRPKLPSWRPSPATRRSLIALAILIIIGLVIYGTAKFWVNWWWFGSVGYRSVLVTRYLTEAVAFVVGGLLAGAFAYANLVVALRRSRGARPRGTRLALGDRFLLALIIIASVAVLLVWGSAASDRWQLWQLFFRGKSFGINDPVFHHDVGFYVFAMPALTALRNGLFALVAVTTVGVIVVYVVRMGVRFRELRRIPSTMRVHVLALVASLLVLFGLGYILANYQLLYSTRGVTFGASYTDVNVQRWANWLLAIVSFVAALLVVYNVFRWRLRWLAGAVGGWVILAVVVGALIPSFVQSSMVKPNELSKERTYIGQNITMTRAAYGLGDVNVRDLSGQGTITQAELNAQPLTFSNVRLWDYRVALQTFQQTKAFVPYYTFNDVDIDRYQIDGKPVQVLISARELDLAGLPDKAQTWTNEHLAYTHGYGVVVSPVSQVSSQGLPVFLVDSVPPNGTGPLKIAQPEIYFGEETNGWVIINSKQKEFTAVPGNNAAAPTMRYQGTPSGSIDLGNYFKRLMTATFLGDRNVLLSGQITGDSQLMLRRNIVDRARTVAPFLTYDPDPYIVVANDRLYWVIDAYTTTDQFPGATRTRGINYMRNTVKVVIDAYNGKMTFYRTETPDPIADAYGSMYGDLFTPIAKCPPAIAAHFRYPELLFNVQTEMFGQYHVTDPTTFYNGDDRWDIAQEQVGGKVQRMESYYVTLTMPSEQQSSYALIVPYTPSGRQNRQNMAAWIAGRLDPKGNGGLVVYRFPRQETVFGPRQIEARINQEPDISSQVSLWNQSGSSVIHGNLLVIPIGQTVLYVQPLYLSATQTESALPEFKRVIVASSDKVVMRGSLEEGLNALIGGGPAVSAAEAEAPPPTSGNQGQGQTGPTSPATGSLAQQALDAYNRSQAALKNGDFDTFGKEQAKLASLLEQLAGTPAATPAATPTP